MIIGEFSESYPPLKDGVSTIVYGYVEGLRALGEDVYAVVSGEKEAIAYDEQHKDDKVLRSIMHVIKIISPYGYTKIKKEVKEKVNEIPFDIVHAHSPFMLGRYAIKTARKKKIPCVMTFHSKYRDDIKRVAKSDFITNLVLKYVVRSFNLSDYVFAVNKMSADVLRSYGYKGKVEVLNNFTEFNVPSQEELISLKREGRSILGLSDTDKILLFVGQLRDEKNFPLVLQSLKLLKNDKAMSALKLVAVGKGPDEIKYKEKAKEYDLEKDVIFTGRIDDRDVLKKIYAASDLLTFPSLYDTFSLVKIEAACFSVPSLLLRGATCTDGTRENINAFYSENDPETYAASIRKIIENEDERSLVGENAKRDLYFSREDAVKELLAKYHEVLHSFKKG